LTGLEPFALGRLAGPALWATSEALDQFLPRVGDGSRLKV
jgi:hypothetical protein